MPRDDVDLGKVNLGGSARQVNTFVAGPRAPRTNSALKLSDALRGLSKTLEEEHDREYQLNVRQATEDKLHGGSLYTQREREALADYEAVKDELTSLDKAEEYFLTNTQLLEPLDSPHAQAGFQENRMKALAEFRGKHAEYLTKKRVEARGRDVFNDFVFNFRTGSAQDSFSRLSQIADNYNLPKEETNKIPLGAAEVLISQGKFKEAEEILRHDRGSAKSLLDHPQTAIEAHKLLSKIQTEDSISIANQIKKLEDTTEDGTEFNDADKFITDQLLKDGHITIKQRNNLLQSNEEAVRVSAFADSLSGNLREPGRTFFDPIPGATQEEADKARKKYTSRFYDEAETKRSSGEIDPINYAKRVSAFSQQTNSTNPAVEQRLGGGFAAFNPNAVIQKGEVDRQTLSAVGEYMTLYRENPQVAAAHLKNDDARKFFDSIMMDVTFGGFQGDTIEKIDQALKNYANDSLNPLEGTSNLRVSDDEIISRFTSITDKAAGRSFFENTGAAENAMQWVPYIKKEIKDASRRTGTSNKTELIDHVVERIVARSQRIGTYLVPKGTNTYIGPREFIDDLNDAQVSRYIQENPEDGYEKDDLVLIPIVGQENLWGVAVKGSHEILEVVPHDQLSVPGSEDRPTNDKRSSLETPQDSTEFAQILKDEGVVKNSAGNHVSYVDSEGYLTGGHGHLMTPEEQKLYPKGTEIPQEVVDEWLATDQKEAKADVKAIFGTVEDPVVEEVLTNMAFNLGRTKLNKFTTFKKAIKEKRYAEAAQAMRDSKWSKQVGPRADRLIAKIESLS